MKDVTLPIAVHCVVVLIGIIGAVTIAVITYKILKKLL